MVTTGQLAVLILATALFAVGGALSLARFRHERERLRIAAKAAMWLGVIASLALLVWHAAARPTGNWLPFDDNFEAYLWLAILLAVFVLYVQRTRPMGGLDWFVTPIVVVLLIAAGVFGRAKPQEYLDTAWSWTHRVTTFGGAAAFAIAGAVGGMYLLATRTLRKKSLPTGGPAFGSLERLEKTTFAAVTLGFALLTIGLVTGLVRIFKQPEVTRLGVNWFFTPKVLLATSVWVVYAIVLHAPINPRLRGRKVAMLSILGCLLMAGSLIAVNLMPGGTR